MKVLFCIEDSAQFESVKLLQNIVRKALGRDIITEINSSEVYSDNYLKNLLINADLIFGFNKRILYLRKKLGIKIPALFFSYGLGQRALLTIFENKDFLFDGDGFICPSMADFKSSYRHLISNQIRLFFIPYPLFDNFLKPGKDVNKKRFLARFNIVYNSELKYLLYAGRINQQKNVHLLIKIIKELNLNKDVYRLIIAGEEDNFEFPELGWNNIGYKKYLVSEISRLGLDDKIYFIGNVSRNRMRDLYSVVDLNISCSTFRTEDFGFVPIEAMSVGLPTVATDWGGFMDTVESGFSGYRIPVYLTKSGLRVNWKRGVEVIENILSDNFFLRRLKDSGFSFALSKYEFKLFKFRLREILKSLCETGISKKISLKNCVSNDVNNYFNDLDVGLKIGKTLFDARKNLFIKNNFERVGLFWKDYLNIYPINITRKTVFYKPLEIKTFGLKVQILDRNWSFVCKISKTEMMVLNNVDGVRNVLSISKNVGMKNVNLIKVLKSLFEKGLIIPY